MNKRFMWLYFGLFFSGVLVETVSTIIQPIEKLGTINIENLKVAGIILMLVGVSLFAAMHLLMLRMYLSLTGEISPEETLRIKTLISLRFS